MAVVVGGTTMERWRRWREWPARCGGAMHEWRVCTHFVTHGREKVTIHVLEKTSTTAPFQSLVCRWTFRSFLEQQGGVRHFTVLCWTVNVWAVLRCTVLLQAMQWHVVHLFLLHQQPIDKRTMRNVILMRKAKGNSWRFWARGRTYSRYHISWDNLYAVFSLCGRLKTNGFYVHSVVNSLQFFCFFAFFTIFAALGGSFRTLVAELVPRGIFAPEAARQPFGVWKLVARTRAPP